MTQRNGTACDDGDSSFTTFGGRVERVGRGDFKGHFHAANRREVNREAQEIRAVGHRWQTPRQDQRKVIFVGRVNLVGQAQHGVFEGEQRPRVDVKFNVQINGSAAAIFGVEVHFPRLTQRVRLHEVAFVVHVKPVGHGVIFEVGDKAGDVDSSHWIQDSGRARYRGYVKESLMDILRTCALEIDDVVRSGTHAGFSGRRPTQYHLDLAADEVALRVLVGAGLRVVSEESGVTGHGDYTVVVDPIDGSTNCDHGIPFYATSLAVLFQGQLVAGLVRNQATGTMYEAELGGGATRDGTTIQVSGLTLFSKSVVAFSGLPSRHLGWSQYRALGSAALEICLVADGSLDVYMVARYSTLNPWDYLGGLAVLREAGGVGVDLEDRELVTDDAETRRPIFAASGELVTFLRDAGTI